MTCCLLKNCRGICLAVQWLGLHASNTRVLGSIPSWDLKSGKLHGKASRTSKQNKKQNKQTKNGKNLEPDENLVMIKLDFPWWLRR